MLTETAKPAAAPASAPSRPDYALIALDHIATSDTPMQKMRRQHFDKSTLQELADSIKAMGVLQPVLLRPDPKFTTGGYYTLVAGERRYLAAKMAGLDKIPATIRPLTDLQVIEMQVVENNQREGLHELIEAEGFDQLRKPPHNLTADAIGAKVGKSRRYVFMRLKLCELCPEAKTAFYDGRIQATVAYQLARIPHHDTQRQALKDLLPRKDEDPKSYREAANHIQQNYMLLLNKAPFTTTDATLCPKAGACGPCPKRTGNQKELFDDVKSADVCTDPKCYADKVTVHNQRRREAALKDGRTVISGNAAKEIFQYEHSDYPHNAVKPTDRCYEDDKHRTYKEILGKEAPPLALVEHPHTHTLHDLWPKPLISKLLAQKLPKKHKASSSRSGGSSSAAKDDNADLINQRFEAEILRLVRAKHSGKLGQIELTDIASGLVDDLSDDSQVFTDWKLPRGYDPERKAIAKLPEKDLHKLIIECLLLESVFLGTVNGIAAELCKQLKIDPKKVKQSVTEQIKKEKAAAAAAAKAPPSGTKSATTSKPAAKAKTKKPVAKK